MISKNSVCALFLLYLAVVSQFHSFRRDASLYGLWIFCLQDFLRPPWMSFDMKLHHALAMIMSFLALLYHDDVEDTYIQVFLQTEISTTFLVIRNYGIHHLVNEILFLLTFVYFRLYKIIQVILIASYPTLSVPLPLYSTAWGILGLNTYWASKIGMYMYRKIKRG